MKIGIIGSGNIGQALGRLWGRKGHQIYYSFSHDENKLEELARESGNDSKHATPYDAVRCSDVVLFSPPWTQIDEAVKQVGRFEGQLVIDTTNPFIDDKMNVEEFDEGDSSSQSVLRRLGDVQLVKAFNTLKAETLEQKHDQGLIVFMAGDDSVAKETVAQLITDAGFVPQDVGPLVEGRNQQPGTDKFLKEIPSTGTRAESDAGTRTDSDISTRMESTTGTSTGTAAQTGTQIGTRADSGTQTRAETGEIGLNTPLTR